MIEVTLRAVRVDVGSSTPLLLLEEVHGERALAVFIGAPEAAAIAYALQGLETPRPMTHDLLANVVTALKARVLAVEISDLVESTFYATLRLLGPDGDVALSARPSDAIALALRVGAPMLVAEHLMVEHGRPFAGDDVDEDDDEAGEDPESLVEEFRAFLDDLDPKDFS